MAGESEFEFDARQQQPPAEPDEATVRSKAVDAFADVRIGKGGYPEDPAEEPEPQQQQAAARPALPLPASALPVPHGVHAVSDLDLLFAELERELDVGPVDLPIPLRPGMHVRYRRLLDGAEMQPWRLAAYDPTVLEGVDPIKMSGLGLAELCVGFVVDGRLVLDADGAPLTFRSSSLRKRLQQPGEKKKPTPAEAVRRWYVLDAHVTATWAAIYALSGFADVIRPQDPPPAAAAGDQEPPDPS